MNKFFSVVFLLVSLVAKAQTWQQIIKNQGDTIGLYNALVKGGVPQNEYAGIIKSKLFRLSNPNYYQPFTVPSYKTSDTNSTCTNAGFEDSTFAGWSGRTGYTPAYGTCCNTNGFVSNRHTIMFGSAMDPNAPAIPVVNPNGGKYSIRLGNDNYGGEAEQLSQTFMVTADKKSFTYSYALVLEDPSHTLNIQPYFEAVMLDQNKDTIPCSYYRVAGGYNIEGIDSVFYTGGFFAGVIYKNWTDVSLDLTDYIGTNVTIQFTTADCDWGGHYGYVYLDTKCDDSGLIPPYFCKGDTLISFSAPSGYQSYEWKKNYTQTIGTTQTIDIIDPQEDDVYEVYLTPFKTGLDSCAFKLSHILKTNPHPVLPDYLLKQNVITANADKMNDKMETDRFMYTDKFSIKIYNRWGKLVFESEDYKKEWDCNDSGAGTYYFHAIFTNTCYPDKDPVESKGYVTVIK